MIYIQWCPYVVVRDPAGSVSGSRPGALGFHCRRRQLADSHAMQDINLLADPSSRYDNPELSN